eukprot:3915411-Pyramimonas_sp.AAC.1
MATTCTASIAFAASSLSREDARTHRATRVALSSRSTAAARLSSTTTPGADPTEQLHRSVACSVYSRSGTRKLKVLEIGCGVRALENPVGRTSNLSNNQPMCTDITGVVRLKKDVFRRELELRVNCSWKKPHRRLVYW